MTPDLDGEDYWALIMSLTGEMPARKVADRILRDHRDLAERAYWAACFAFNVKAGLQTADAMEDDDPDGALLERRKTYDLLDVMFYMLGGEDDEAEEEATR
jgi:hypothetical protein